MGPFDSGDSTYLKDSEVMHVLFNLQKNNKIKKKERKKEHEH
jgi:hypothetical protein